MRNLLVILSVMILNGCFSRGTGEPARLDVQLYEDYSFQFHDERPDKQKGFDKGSGNRNACSFGIYQYSDAVSDPDKVTYLKNRLEQVLGNRFSSGTAIRLKSFAVYLNAQAAIRGGLAPPTAGEISAGVYGILDSFNCWADESKLGGYDLARNPSGISVTVAEIDITINGHNFAVHEVFVPGPGEEEVLMVPRVIEMSVNSLIDKIEAAI